MIPSVFICLILLIFASFHLEQKDAINKFMALKNSVNKNPISSITSYCREKKASNSHCKVEVNWRYQEHWNSPCTHLTRFWAPRYYKIKLSCDIDFGGNRYQLTHLEKTIFR